MTTQPNRNIENSDLSLAMEKYAAGDQRAFSLVHRGMAPRLYAFLLRETRNEAQAEDLVQQTFLQVHSARSRYVPGTEVAPWLFSIARHLLIDARRRTRPSTSLSEDQDEGRTVPSELMCSASADEKLYSKQLESLLDNKLRAFPEKHRTLFRLVKIEGFSHAEAAESMGTTSSAVKVRMHRISRMILGDPAEYLSTAA
jgi:RNA polymerase sigma-70 factor (ECF subfamily)